MIFSDVELEWNGVTYRIKGDGQIMQALAVVEDHLTIGELVKGQQSGLVPLAKISAAYASVLRLAGARVSDAEVYRGMWEGGVNQDQIAGAITHLMQMMIPPGALTEEDKPGNAPAPQAGGSKSKSKRPSKRR